MVGSHGYRDVASIQFRIRTIWRLVVVAILGAVLVVMAGAVIAALEGRPPPIDASSGLLGVIILVEVSKALIVALPTVGGVVSLGAALVLLRRALALVIRGKRTEGRVVLRSPSDLGADEENAIVCIAYSDREGNARCFRPNVRLSFLGLGLGAEVGVIFSSASSGRAVIDRFPCVWGPGLMVLAFSLAALSAGTLGIDFFYGLT